MGDGVGGWGDDVTKRRRRHQMRGMVYLSTESFEDNSVNQRAGFV